MRLRSNPITVLHHERLRSMGRLRFTPLTIVVGDASERWMEPSGRTLTRHVWGCRYRASNHSRWPRSRNPHFTREFGHARSHGRCVRFAQVRSWSGAYDSADSAASYSTFLFIPPYRTVAIRDAWYLITLITFMSVAQLISPLTSAAREQAFGCEGAGSGESPSSRRVGRRLGARFQ